MIVTVTRKSPFSGNTNTMHVNVTQTQLDMYKGGALIQVAFPDLTADEREFIKTGITAEEWAETFPEG